jgi:hypothetical protein
MAQTGRISGPLLKSNLERQGKNLTFRNTLESDPLFFLDVNQQRLGIDTDQVTADLSVAKVLRSTNFQVDQQFDISNFTIQTNTIEQLTGNIFLTAQDTVKFGGLSTGTLFVKGNSVATEVSDADIDLDPNQSGIVNFLSNTNVENNLYTPGNITLDGTITLGNETEDTVDFNAFVDSDIIPRNPDTFALGSQDKTWKTLFTRLVNGEQISTGDLTVDNLDLSFKPDNIYYVASNGDDENFGNHIQAPFASVKKALELAEQQTEPTTVYVFPGVYQEQFPLEVSSNTNIIGIDLRHVIIEPTAETNNKDCFLLDGETSIENVTVRNFYFDDNQGYAFRFKLNGKITERSPYIKNVTVKTTGTVSENDNKGYNAGNAGRGAYIDGAELSSDSESASMLFNACTFITPGADAITMTNGVRVEWLSCFTYYAKRGLYAFNDSSGRVTRDGTVNFGAEIRSIASANVYGSFGVVADGDDCLMYLINHNFAYIGSQDSSDNDKTLAKEDQEVVETNNGRIVFTSIDHNGKYKVGDLFNVDFESGSTNISGDILSADDFTVLNITDNGNTTVVDNNKITTPKIIISGNEIESVEGPINFLSSNRIKINSNTNIERDLGITGDLSFGGSLSVFGNQPNDTVNFNTPISQNFVPELDITHNLGSFPKKWKNSYIKNTALESIEITNDSIRSTVSDSDIDLRANAAGKIHIESLFFKTNTISTETDSVKFSASITDFLSTKAIQLPVGSRSDYHALSASQTADIRFNTDDDLFEGFNQGRITFKDIYSDDRNTRVFANSSNELKFVADNTESVSINQNSISANRMLVDEVLFDNNLIKNNINDQDLVLEKSTNRDYVIDNFLMRQGTLRKNNTDSFTIQNTNLGYTKLQGTNGVVIPVGNTSTRYTNPEIGDTRFNTDLDFVETWDGSVWIDSAGTSKFVDEEEYNEILIELTLMFG